MKILDLGEFYSERGGGVRSYLSAMLTACAEYGHELVVVAPGPSHSDEAVEGGRILRYRAPHMPYDSTYHVPYRMGLMRQIVERESPDVLQLSSPLLPWVASRKIKKPLRSYVYHSDPIGAYVRPASLRLPRFASRAALAGSWAWMRSVCNSCDLTVVAGAWLGDQLAQHGIGNAQAIPFGIEHHRFSPERRSSKLRAELFEGLNQAMDPRLVVVAGRLAVEKRQALVLRAVAEVARDRPIALLVLGDGPESERLRRLAAELGIVHRFLPFTKDRDEYAEVLASADVLMHGSACETYGFVLVEALASGTPLVVPDEGGAAHAAENELARSLYPSNGGVQAAAAALRAALDKPAEASRAAARAEALRHPTKLGHFEQLFQVYAERL